VIYPCCDRRDDDDESKDIDGGCVVSLADINYGALVSEGATAGVIKNVIEGVMTDENVRELFATKQRLGASALTLKEEEFLPGLIMALGGGGADEDGKNEVKDEHVATVRFLKFAQKVIEAGEEKGKEKMK